MKINAKIKSLLEIVLFIAFLFINYLGIGFFSQKFVPIQSLQQSTFYIIFEFLLFLAIVVAILATQAILNPMQNVLGFKEKSKLLTDALKSPQWGVDLMLGFTLGAVFITVTMALVYLGGGYTPDMHINLNFNVLVPLVFFLFVGLAEELIFRGFIFLSVEKGFGTKIAIVVASLLFGFFHMVNQIDGIGETYKPLACLFMAIEAGFMLNAAFLIRRSLWIPVGIHWSWNLFETSIFGAKEGQIDFLPSLFTGHYNPGLFLPGFPMGMESSYVTLVTGFLTGLILLKYAKSTKLSPPES